MDLHRPQRRAGPLAFNPVRWPNTGVPYSPRASGYIKADAATDGIWKYGPTIYVDQVALAGKQISAPGLPTLTWKLSYGLT